MNTLPSCVVPAALNRALLPLLQLGGTLLTLKSVDTGRYLWASPPQACLLGVEVSRLIGATDQEQLPLQAAALIRAGDLRARFEAEPTHGEHHFELGSRGRQSFSLQRQVLPAVDGAPLLLTLWRDQSHQHQESQLLQKALRQIERQQSEAAALQQEPDRPMPLFRHDQFETQLRRERALAWREQREFALALLRFDGFEAMSASEGAAAAQQMLEAIGQLLRSNTREMDVVARLGNERYAVLLSGAGLANAHARIDQLRRECAARMVVQGGRILNMEISVGLASYPHSADTLAELSQAAERALDEAIRRGGNNVALAGIPLVPVARRQRPLRRA